jgi:hypothetical protein
MLSRTISLYSLPYIVGIASLAVTADYVFPPLNETLFEVSSKRNTTDIFAHQVVNRSLKGDQLTIHQSVESGNEPFPGPIAPSPQIKVGCERPFSSTVRGLKTDIVGRCLAYTKQRDSLLGQAG